MSTPFVRPFVLFAACFGLIATNHADAQVCGQWQSKASMPVAAAQFSIGVLGGRIYCACGGWPPLTAAESYNPVTDSWTPLATSPIATEAHGSSLNGMLYVAGGNASGFCTSAVQMYNPATNSWVLAPSMPTPRCHSCAAAVNGMLYVFGGTNTSGNVDYNVVEAFNPATSSWTAKAPMPTGRSNADATVVDGLIYVVGGSAAGSLLGNVEAYDPASNTWSTRAPLNVPRASVGVCECNGTLYAAGGQVAGGVITGVVEAYNPATNSWSARPPMLQVRSSPGLFSLHGTIYAIGGGNSSGGISTVESFTECIPACRADYNQDGHLAVQDIFDFLSGWFSGCP
jgi:N-acetylneuraminic acid mutarotase